MVLAGQVVIMTAIMVPPVEIHLNDSANSPWTTQAVHHDVHIKLYHYRDECSFSIFGVPGISAGAPKSRP